MLLDKRSQLGLVLLRDLSGDDAVAVELLPFQQVGGAARHAGAGVPAHRPQRHSYPARHVLAEVIAGALDHRDRAGVAHAEALADASRDEHAAAGRAVRDRVAGENRVGRAVVPGWGDDDEAAGHALADVVLGLALENDLDVAVQERPERLPRAAAVHPGLS